MKASIASLLLLLGIDALLIMLLILALVPLALYRHAAFAVLKRNVTGYFTRPLGYIFLCVFVLAASFFAFCFESFYVTNLATLDQLEWVMPVMLLMFASTISMSIWSEERRQGTDELLLTLPAADFDIVIGKYLAAATIFTVSLLFSQIANFTVLVAMTRGDVDIGLFFSTYFGYWLAGLAMIALGMVASFLTNDMPVGFILGALFNAPLVLASYPDWFFGNQRIGRWFYGWSVASWLEDFSRGVISIAGISYFATIIVLGIYLSMVLIGRRHWLGGKDGQSLLGHYLMRIISLVVIALAVATIFNRYDFIRVDATEARINSIHPDTRAILQELNPKHPIVIEAYLSDEVPQEYIQTRRDLLTMIREVEKSSGGKVRAKVYQGVKPSGELAQQAEKKHGIEAQVVRTETGGKIVDRDLVLGAAFTCGLEKLVVPFFDYGIPVEYELMRSLATVARGERKKVGIVRTEAQMMGGFTFAGGMPQNMPKQPLIEELEKQYDVEEVDPNNTIELGRYAVLLAVQPSSLQQNQLENLLAAIRMGQPTAIFEDPRPDYFPQVAGTTEPKRPQSPMFGGAPPKADFSPFWNELGVEFRGMDTIGGEPEIVWQHYNPYKRVNFPLPDTMVFADREFQEVRDVFSVDDSITAKLRQVLFIASGAIVKRGNTKLKMTTLVQTGPFAGRIPASKYMELARDPENAGKPFGQPEGEQVVAVRLQGKDPKKASSGKDDDHAGHDHGDEDKDAKNKQDDKTSKPGDPKPVNVVLVADIDLLTGLFVRLRAHPEAGAQSIPFRFENVTFVLNAIDSLAQEDSFFEIRGRKSDHKTLRTIEDQIEAAREAEFTEVKKLQDQTAEAEKEIETLENELAKKLEAEFQSLIKKQNAGERIDINSIRAKQDEHGIEERLAKSRAAVKKDALKTTAEKNIKEMREETDQKINSIQSMFKFWSLFLPPIPPLVVALVVFLRRSLREREGVSAARLR